MSSTDPEALMSASAVSLARPEWATAFEAARGAPLTVVVGPPDAGKTTLVTALVNDLGERGYPVAVVDTDLGQSEIGPPTTIGLGRAAGRLRRLGDAEVLALHFVGTTSPSGNLLGALVGTRHLVDRARALGFARIVVDTSGLVTGSLGQWLKRAKIDLLAPDLLVGLQRDGELEPILHAYDGSPPPVVTRVPALSAVPGRSPDVRRRHRERAYAAHLAGAAPVELDLRRVVLRHPPLFAGVPLTADEIAALSGRLERPLLWAARRGSEVVLVVDGSPGEMDTEGAARALAAHPIVVHRLGDFVDAIAGLDDRGRHTLGLGVVEALDVSRRVLRVRTAVPEPAIAGVTIGRAVLEAERGPDA